ncbi:MAG: hypothetical protein ACI9Q3_001016 [Maribacter sp.]|jgi:hypothetical protein
MTNTIVANVDARFQSESFILLRPKSKFYKIGEKFIFVDRSQLYQKTAYLKCIDTYKLIDLPESYIYLDSNTTKNTFLQIQSQVYKTSDRLTLEDYPLFLVHLKDSMLLKDFLTLEHHIFKTFKPLTLLEILTLYQSMPFYNAQTFQKLYKIVMAGFDQKQMSVLTFSSHVPENEIIKRMNQIKENDYVN